MIDVTLLGTAATLPKLDRALSALTLTCAGRTLLFDCGEGTQLALHRWHVNPMRITMICLTHYHGDHIFGLPGLLQTLGTLGRTDPLYITGPEGLETVMASILALAEEEQLPYPVRLLPLPEAGLSLHAIDRRWPADAVLSAFPTMHRVVSQGYRFNLARRGRFHAAKAEALGVPPYLWRRLQKGEAVSFEGRTILPEMVCGPARKGLSVVFTGDTAACGAVEEAARGADLLVMDATYDGEDMAEKAEVYGHSTFGQTARLAAKAGVRALWLTHFSATIEAPEEVEGLAKEKFAGARCGMDGLHAQLTFTEDSLSVPDEDNMKSKG